MLPMRSQLANQYGSITNGVWADSAKWLKVYTVPQALLPNFHYQGAMVKHISMHEAMLPAFTQAIQNAIDRGLQSCIKSFDGCWMVRNTRGSAELSVHCWGLAIDFNASTNQLGSKGDIDPRLVQCFKDVGFIWGGDFHRLDPMHFQYCSEN